MSTTATGNFAIESKFVNGVQYWYEKSVGRTVTGDILSMSTTAFTVGGTGQDVDFAFYGTGSLSAIIDCGAKTFTLTGIDLATDSDITMGTASKLVIPVKASGSTTNGDTWVDTTDNLIHYYTNGHEYTVTAS